MAGMPLLTSALQLSVSIAMLILRTQPLPRGPGGTVGLFTRGPPAKVSVAPESSRLPGPQTGSLAGPGRCGHRRGKAGGAGCPQAEAGRAPSPDGPRTEGREGLWGQACLQPPLASGWSVRAEEGSAVLSQLGASDGC